MFEKLKTVAAVTALLTLAACSDSAVEAPDSVASESKVSEASEPNSDIAATNVPSYEILEDEVQGTIKRTVEVELSSRTDEKQLKALAEQIYALKDVDVQRTFIGYRIAGEQKSQAYWATTNYDPDLKVKIMGDSGSDYEKVKDAALPDGDVLGSWMISWGLEYKSVAYEKDGKTYMRNIHSDGSQGDELYEQSKSDKGIKLQDESGKDNNEYFIINKQGDLEFWSDNGNYYTAKKV